MTGRNPLSYVGTEAENPANVILADRDPNGDDKTIIGTIWINQINDTLYIITSVVNDVANWTLFGLAPTSIVGVENGGTGLATLTDGAVVVGNGTSDVSLVGPGTDGQLLIGDTGADPAFATLGVSNGLTATAGAGTLAVQITNWAQTTFTPALTPSGVAYDSITYTTQNGNHTRIGNMIILSAFVEINAVTVGSATGDLLITGLPVAAAATPLQVILACATSGIDLAASATGIFAKILATESQARPFTAHDNAAAAAITAASVANGDQIWIHGMYMV